MCLRPHNQANALADKSINVLAEASEYMQRDLEEFTKVVTEDATTVYSKVAEVTYQSINDYAGEEIAQDALNIKSVSAPKLPKYVLCGRIQHPG